MPAQFFAMTDDEKLASPSFEEMDAGLVFGSDAVGFDELQIVAAPLEYESIVIDAAGQSSTPAGQVRAERGAAARAGAFRRGRAGADSQRRPGALPRRRRRRSAATLSRRRAWVIASVTDTADRRADDERRRDVDAKRARRWPRSIGPRQAAAPSGSSCRCTRPSLDEVQARRPFAAVSCPLPSEAKAGSHMRPGLPPDGCGFRL